MGSSEEAGSITVRVKHGSLKCGDLDVRCKLQDKVLTLKQLICDISPSHPEIKDQRLIHAGHLLKDDQTLKEIFAPSGETSDTCFIVHLAFSRFVSTRYQQTPPSTSQSKPETNQNSSSPASSGQPRQNAGNGVNMPNFANAYSFPASPHMTATGMSQDYIAMHEFYLNQMMAYMLQWSQISYQIIQNANNVHFHPGATPGNAMPVLMRTGIPRVNQPQQQPEPAVLGNVPAEPARHNHVHHHRDEEEGGQRDIVDWIFTIMRVAFIFSVVYFYSNFTRFFLVVLCTALVVVFQRRQGARARQLAAERLQQQQDQAAAAAAAAPASPEARPPGDGSGDPAQSGTSDAAGNPPEVKPGEASPTNDTQSGTSEAGNVAGDAQPAETAAPNTDLVAAQRLSLRDITWTFFTTFFSSLIPEIPQNN